MKKPPPTLWTAVFQDERPDYLPLPPSPPPWPPLELFMPLPFFMAPPELMPLVVPLFRALPGSVGLVPLVPAFGALVMPGSDGLCCDVCADARPVVTTSAAAARPTVNVRIVFPPLS